MIDIYIITNMLNGKQYVGKTQRGYELRFKEHCSSYTNGFNTYIGNAIHKYGAENFRVDLLKQVPDDSWEYWEAFYIKKFKTLFTQGGYNLTPGGDCNPMDVPEVRQRHLEACRTEEHRKRISEACKNKVVSEKTRERIRQNNKLNADRVLSGFRQYNESKKIKVSALLDDVVIASFDSLSDACTFVGTPATNGGCILAVCDKYNKNGKRAKIYGYSWKRN